MKVYSVLLIFVISLTTNIFSQVQFIQHTIITDGYWPQLVYAVDVDADEDIDILSASYGEIAWHENDGNENFTDHTIKSVYGGVSVYAADVDGDGDMDVLSASNEDGNLAWYENDGNENFTTHTLSTGGAYSVYAVDVDDDGDMDVLSASGDGDKIAWYENDGSENFTTHIIASNANGAQSVSAVDVDGDGDMDVLSASWGDAKINWYENDGNENFTIHTIRTNDADGARSVYAVDVDSDGDIDVLSASWYDDKITWYENDGNENFTTHTITTSADGALSVYAIDVDGDGDMDVLSASNEDDKIAWYENDGNENFTTHTITTTASGAHSVYAVDVDGDGDIDVLSASSGHSYLEGEIAWYENLSPPIPVELTSFSATIDQVQVTLHWTTATETNNLGFEVHRKIDKYDWESIGFIEGHGTTTEPNDYTYIDGIRDISATSINYRLKQVDFEGGYEYSDEVLVEISAPLDYALHQNFPNPYNPVTTIRYSLPIKAQVEIVIYNTLGEKVIQLVNKEKEAAQHSVEFNATSLPSGIYFYRLQAGSFVETKKMVLMK